MIEYTIQARDDLLQLDPVIRRRIAKKMRWFAAQEQPLTFAKKLKEIAEETWRFRIGDYRALCRMKNGTLQILQVLTIKHRKEVYKHL